MWMYDDKEGEEEVKGVCETLMEGGNEGKGREGVRRKECCEEERKIGKRKESWGC